MLPQANRLHNREDIQKVFKNGRFFSVGILVASILANGTKKTRIGFIVSKKVSAKATDRNRLRRQSREHIRKMLAQIKEGQDIVFTIQPSALKTNKTDLISAIERLLRKSDLLK